MSMQSLSERSILNSLKAFSNFNPPLPTYFGSSPFITILSSSFTEKDGFEIIRSFTKTFSSFISCCATFRLFTIRRLTISASSLPNYFTHGLNYSFRVKLKFCKLPFSFAVAYKAVFNCFNCKLTLPARLQKLRRKFLGYSS